MAEEESELMKKAEYLSPKSQPACLPANMDSINSKPDSGAYRPDPTVPYDVSLSAKESHHQCGAPAAEASAFGNSPVFVTGKTQRKPGENSGETVKDSTNGPSEETDSLKRSPDPSFDPNVLRTISGKESQGDLTANKKAEAKELSGECPSPKQEHVHDNIEESRTFASDNSPSSAKQYKKETDGATLNVTYHVNGARASEKNDFQTKINSSPDSSNSGIEKKEATNIEAKSPNKQPYSVSSNILPDSKNIQKCYPEKEAKRETGVVAGQPKAVNDVVFGKQTLREPDLKNQRKAFSTTDVRSFENSGIKCSTFEHTKSFYSLNISLNLSSRSIKGKPENTASLNLTCQEQSSYNVRIKNDNTACDRVKTDTANTVTVIPSAGQHKVTHLIEACNCVPESNIVELKQADYSTIADRGEVAESIHVEQHEGTHFTTAELYRVAESSIAEQYEVACLTTTELYRVALSSIAEQYEVACPTTAELYRVAESSIAEQYEVACLRTTELYRVAESSIAEQHEVACLKTAELNQVAESSIAEQYEVACPTTAELNQVAESSIAEQYEVACLTAAELYRVAESSIAEQYEVACPTTAELNQVAESSIAEQYEVACLKTTELYRVAESSIAEQYEVACLTAAELYRVAESSIAEQYEVACPTTAELNQVAESSIAEQYEVACLTTTELYRVAESSIAEQYEVACLTTTELYWVAESSIAEQYEVACLTTTELYRVAESSIAEQYEVACLTTTELYWVAESSIAEQYEVACLTTAELNQVAESSIAKQYEVACPTTAELNQVAESSIAEQYEVACLITTELYWVAESSIAEQYEVACLTAAELNQVTESRIGGQYEVACLTAAELNQVTESRIGGQYEVACLTAAELNQVAEISIGGQYEVACLTAVELNQVAMNATSEQYDVASDTLAQLCLAAERGIGEPHDVAYRAAGEPRLASECSSRQQNEGTNLTTGEARQVAEINTTVICVPQVQGIPPDNCSVVQATHLQPRRGVSRLASQNSPQPRGSCSRWRHHRHHHLQQQQQQFHLPPQGHNRRPPDPCPDCLRVRPRGIRFPRSVWQCSHANSSFQVQGDNEWDLDFHELQRLLNGFPARNLTVRILGEVVFRRVRERRNGRPCPQSFLPPRGRHGLGLPGCQFGFPRSTPSCLCCLRVQPRNDVRCPEDSLCDHRNSSVVSQGETEDISVHVQFGAVGNGLGQGRQPAHQLCCFCHSRQVGAQLFNCLHRVTCFPCALYLRFCPACWQEILCVLPAQL